MAQRRLNRVPSLDVRLLQRLQSHQVIAAKDLFKKRGELLDMGFMPQEVSKIVEEVALAITPPAQSVFNLLAYEDSIGELSLGTNLQIKVGLTELVGGAGLGKTQSCLTLAVLATLPRNHGGLGGGVVYVDTEHAFSASRLMEVAVSRWPALFTSAVEEKGLISKVTVFNEAQTPQQLLRTLNTLEDILIGKDIKLLIVDSIAAPNRGHGGHGGGGAQVDHRFKTLASLASKLKYISQTFRIPVVVTNQIRSNYHAPGLGHERDIPQAVADSYLSATLGVAWAHAVNTRFVLRDTDQGKLITVAKSPSVPALSYKYEITAKGFEVILEST
eukprot:CAMPEP_0175131134 /NCGR_PEP_ID=MMETSP0087-20121206/6375_1 /TAXON_ID=136419 /ORGANISM="Unknown Unknown, Strain D1" /LENGTH=329 /DNA_ID=CAMNT_0016413393 /DNA_START=22 /DNA_END=1011 /DNA_ORIENTATION=+